MGGGDEEKQKQSVILYELAADRAEYFVDKTGVAYALFLNRGRRECRALRTQMFRNFLASIFYTEEGSIPSSNAVQEALGLLEWEAQDTQRDVFTRVAGCEGKIYIDLGNKEWEAVELDQTGWRIVKEPPVAFRRTNAIAAMPTPATGGGHG